MWRPSLSSFCPSCLSQWLPVAAEEHSNAMPANENVEGTNHSRLDKICRVASIVLTSCVLLFTYSINPTWVGTSFLIGLFSHDRLYYIIRRELLHPATSHPYVTAFALLICTVVDRRFAFVAASIVYAAYCGSAIHVVEEARNSDFVVEGMT